LQKEQVNEWLENPVTLFLLDEVKKELERIRRTPTSSCLIHGDPYKTHENIVGLEARESVWTDWQEFLEGNWDFFEESYDEQIRD